MVGESGHGSLCEMPVLDVSGPHLHEPSLKFGIVPSGPELVRCRPELQPQCIAPVARLILNLTVKTSQRVSLVLRRATSWPNLSDDNSVNPNLL